MTTELIRGIYNIKPHHRRCVATIGNFDGVHRGHQTLLATLTKTAKSLQLPSVVILFEPQPIEFFSPQKPAARLMRLREKFYALAACGVDRVLVIHFNEVLAKLTASDFVSQILNEKLDVQHVIVGDDFHFGFKREGNAEFLKKSGLNVTAMPTYLIDGERVSSTRVRAALQQFNPRVVQQLLGQPYSMIGRVVHGDKLGRQLGFPTANIYLHRALSPVLGIFAVKLTLLRERKTYLGVANVGIRPTVGGTRTLLEVYVLDFDRDIYGEPVQVEFCEKFRDEKYFPNLDILKEYIQKDVTMAREYFKL